MTRPSLWLDNVRVCVHVGMLSLHGAQVPTTIHRDIGGDTMNSLFKIRSSCLAALEAGMRDKTARSL